MRAFLVHKNTDGTERIHAEILSFDRSTNVMKVKLKNGFIHTRVFLPDSRYNKTDFRIATREDDDA